MRGKRPNIILLTVDSLRFDRLGCYGSGLPTSPHIDAFARESYFFQNAFSVGPNTPHAFPGIMASRSPLASRRLGLFDASVTLPEKCRESGYFTIGMNAGNPYVSRFFQYDRGFDVFQDYIDFAVPFDSGNSSSMVAIPQLDAHHYAVTAASLQQKVALEETFSKDVISLLSTAAQLPFFLWVHLMDPHYPYVPRREFQDKVAGDAIPLDQCLHLNQRVRESGEVNSRQLAQIQRLYNASIRQADTKIGELFAYLKQASLYNDALIVITADHGEEFQEHGDLQHLSKLYDELVRVPLMIKLSGQRHGEKLEQMCSLIGLAPTILTQAGIEHAFAPRGFFDFSNASAAVPFIFAEASYGPNGGTPVAGDMLKTDAMPKRFCIRSKQWKLILDTQTESPTLYNLLEDPDEKFPAETEDPEVRALHRQLHNHIHTVARTRVREQVRSLRHKLIDQNNEDYALRLS